MQPQQIEIYTDGSLKGQYGSWAYLIIQGGQIIHEASGREKKTDSNRMEFQAVIESLKSLPPGANITLFTDSRVLIENIPHFEFWESNQWLKKNNRPIPNVDLYKILYELIKIHKITWQWVKAHSGNTYNERCDELCAQSLMFLPINSGLKQKGN